MILIPVVSPQRAKLLVWSHCAIMSMVALIVSVYNMQDVSLVFPQSPARYPPLHCTLIAPHRPHRPTQLHLLHPGDCPPRQSRLSRSKPTSHDCTVITSATHIRTFLRHWEHGTLHTHETLYTAAHQLPVVVPILGIDLSATNHNTHPPCPP